MSDEVDRFIESPEYEYAKQAGERVFDTLMHEGVFEAWVELLIALAPQGETHAYRVRTNVVWLDGSIEWVRLVYEYGWVVRVSGWVGVCTNLFVVGDRGFCTVWKCTWVVGVCGDLF